MSADCMSSQRTHAETGRTMHRSIAVMHTVARVYCNYLVTYFVPVDHCGRHLNTCDTLTTEAAPDKTTEAVFITLLALSGRKKENTPWTILDISFVNRPLTLIRCRDGISTGQREDETKWNENERRLFWLNSPQCESCWAPWSKYGWRNLDRSILPGEHDWTHVTELC